MYFYVIFCVESQNIKPKKQKIVLEYFSFLHIYFSPLFLFCVSTFDWRFCNLFILREVVKLAALVLVSLPISFLFWDWLEKIGKNVGSSVKIVQHFNLWVVIRLSIINCTGRFLGHRCVRYQIREYWRFGCLWKWILNSDFKIVKFSFIQYFSFSNT